MDDSKSDQDEQTSAERTRIFRLLSEAVNESPSIKDYSEYPHSRAYYCRHWILNDEEDWNTSLPYRRERGRNSSIDLFKVETSNDIILLIQSTQIRFTSWFEIALFDIAHLLFFYAEHELSKPEVERTFEVVSAQERAETIDYAVKSVLRRLFWALPNLIFQATNGAIHDSILSYIKTDVQRNNRLRWKRMGLPKNYEYLPPEILELLNLPIKAIDDWRQRFTGNKREIPEPELIKLPGRYKELRKAYKIAKKEHRQKKEKFLAGENRRSAEDWREQWKREFVYYPELYEDCLMLICEDEMIMPRELAYQHLSFIWGYSPDQMRRNINNQKAIMKGGKRKVTHPDKK